MAQSGQFALRTGASSQDPRWWSGAGSNRRRHDLQERRTAGTWRNTANLGTAVVPIASRVGTFGHEWARTQGTGKAGVRGEEGRWSGRERLEVQHIAPVPLFAFMLGPRPEDCKFAERLQTWQIWRTEGVVNRMRSSRSVMARHATKLGY